MTYQKDEFSRVNLQGDIMQGGLVGLRGIHLGHVVERDDRSPHGLLLHILHGKRWQRGGQVGQNARSSGSLRMAYSRETWRPLPEDEGALRAPQARRALGLLRHLAQRPHDGLEQAERPEWRPSTLGHDAARRSCSSQNAPFISWLLDLTHLF